MRIEKYYEENANLGNYESARVGLKLSSDKEIKTAEELETLSHSLFQLAKTMVRKELSKLKEERQKSQEEV